MTKDNECRRIFPVTGMSCAACATRVEKTIAHTKGVRSAAVNFAASEVTVEYDLHARAAARGRTRGRIRYYM